jgi:hypothetical protein
MLPAFPGESVHLDALLYSELYWAKQRERLTLPNISNTTRFGSLITFDLVLTVTNSTYSRCSGYGIANF